MSVLTVLKTMKHTFVIVIVMTRTQNHIL